jgi:hypothetical protein
MREPIFLKISCPAIEQEIGNFHPHRKPAASGTEEDQSNPFSRDSQNRASRGETVFSRQTWPIVERRLVKWQTTEGRQLPRFAVQDVPDSAVRQSLDRARGGFCPAHTTDPRIVPGGLPLFTLPSRNHRTRARSCI